MRALSLASIGLALTTSCVKGNPEAVDFDGPGGTVRIPDCGYDLTTRLDAEKPMGGVPMLGPDPTPRLVHLGIMGDPRTSIVAQWRTADEITLATTMRYAKGADLPASDLTEARHGVQFAYHATGTGILRQHQVHLCDLEPGTAYSYQVGGSDAVTGRASFSPVYTFRTAPDVVSQPDAEVVFGFVGDSRGGYVVWQSILEDLLQRQPDLVLFSGDAVTDGRTQDEWEDFFHRGEPLFARAAFVMAHGNHEVNAINYYSQIAMPGDQENFGFDYGYAHITIANDTPDDPIKITQKHRAAIAADFAASDNARWKLFMHHQPMFSSSLNHGSNVTLQEAWLPLVDAHHIDLVLNGHDHIYEVTKPMVNKQVQPTSDDATVFVIAGGAGAPLYENDFSYFTEYSEKTYNAAVIRVRRDQMTMEAFRHDGTPISTGFSKTKP